MRPYYSYPLGNTFTGGILLALALFLVAIPAAAQLTSYGGLYYYVAPTGSDSNDGTAPERPFRTLSKACRQQAAGDTLLVRGGAYANDFCFTGTGTQQQPITIQAYPGETPVVTGLSTWGGYFFIYNPWVTLDGIHFQDTDGGVNVVVGSNRIALRNLSFLRNSGDTNVRLLGCDNVVIENSTFDGTGSKDDGGSGDNIYVLGSTRVLIQGNTFRRAGHASVDFIESTTYGFSAFNVIRNNTIEQHWGGGIYLVRGSHHIVVEGNRISYAGEEDVYPKAGLQIAADHNIIRNNIVANTGTATNIDNGIALYAYTYAGISQNATDNRIYNNDVYGSSHAGLYLWVSGDSTLTGNKIVNNIFFRNHTMGDWEPFWPAGDYYLGFELYHSTNRWPSFPNQNYFLNNIILHNAGGADVPGIPLVYYDADSSAKTLTQVQTDYPAYFKGNLEQNPGFRDALAGDVSLGAGSPAIDTGAFLAATTAPGVNTNLVPIDDPLFFTDGYGIVSGDRVRIGGNAPATITRVDYTLGTLTVDNTVSFSAGDRVSLVYNGAAPDIGAMESALPTVDSVVPSSGSGTSQNFTFTVSDANGSAGIAGAAILIAPSPSAVNACLVAYDRAANTVLLVYDDPMLGAFAIVPGSTSVVSNSQCTLSARNTSIVIGLTTVAVTVNLGFASTYSGTKNVYLYASTGAASVGWSGKGTWTVPVTAK